MPVTPELCHVLACPQCLSSHAAIIQALFELKDSHQARKSHYFAGRYENIYLERDAIPTLGIILDTALDQAAHLLARPTISLKLGFWFNLMQQGDVTLPHSHDDDDELLSATYYLQVPPQAGHLMLKLAAGVREIIPVEGHFVFFDPRIEHEVSRHPHPTARISLGINIGPAEAG